MGIIYFLWPSAFQKVTIIGARIVRIEMIMYVEGLAEPYWMSENNSRLLDVVGYGIQIDARDGPRKQYFTRPALYIYIYYKLNSQTHKTYHNYSPSP